MTISAKVSTQKAGFFPGAEHTSDCTEMTAAGGANMFYSEHGWEKCTKWEALQIT